MKINVKNLLRGGVFVMAAAFAFAFTQPTNFQTAWGEDPQKGVFQVTIGSNEYECNQQPVQCLYEDPELTKPIEDSMGQFRYLGNK